MSIWTSIDMSGFDLYFGFLGLFSVKVYAIERMPSDQILLGRKFVVYMPGERDMQGRWMKGAEMPVSFGPKEVSIQ